MKTILSAFLLICCSLISQAQVYPVNANLEDEKSFSMILLPDPQSYIKFAANQPLFDLQTAWIANNIETLHIKNVLCTGDFSHKYHITDYVQQISFRTDKKHSGNEVAQMMFNAQTTL